MDLNALRDAGLKARELWDDIKAIDASGGSMQYSTAITDRMREMYRAGSPDPLVTREFCRDVVVAMLWDLFQIRVHDTSADEVSDVPPGESVIQNPLDIQSMRLFRSFLMNDLLPTAPEDLDPLQQARLYRLAGLILKPDKDVAIGVLDTVAAKFDRKDPMHELVQLAIADLNSE